ncbi:chemosensory receptor C [Elysia marginata]|uniref:Chemosensory receptor C n=1 Tax=Elysia marginata TaxID=1093978 RepID=A0AAV4JE40_9GAST|nr:chemosensory receptor C [Elysia marginata]
MNGTTEISTADEFTSQPETPLYAAFPDAKSLAIVEIVLDYGLALPIAVVGVVTNILVITVFAKQGFRESVAISLTNISVWYLTKCLAGVFKRLFRIMSDWGHVDIFTRTSIPTSIVSYLINVSRYVTTVMAAYVEVERCLCVSIPLKVKWLLTPGITLTACLVISVMGFSDCFIQMLRTYKTVWLWDPFLNATVARTHVSGFFFQHYELVFKYYTVSSGVWRLASFVVIIIATAIITYKLKQGSKFRLRRGNANAGTFSPAKETLTSKNEKRLAQRILRNEQMQRKQPLQLSKRDTKVLKMLVVTLTIYIAAMSPRISLYILNYGFREHLFNFVHLLYLYQFFFYWYYIFEFFDAAVHFFVLFEMSSSFRSTFRSIILRQKRTSAYRLKL